MVTGYSANPSFGSDGFNPAFKIDSGFPQFTPPPNLDPGQLDNGNANAPQFVGGSYIAAKYGRPAMVNQWNMQVQQEVAKDLIFTVGYVGQAHRTCVPALKTSTTSTGRILRAGINSRSTIWRQPE